MGESQAEVLAAGLQVIGRAAGTTFKYYSFEVTDCSQMLTIWYSARSAEPFNEESDPDIYVSNKDQVVTQENYMWKSTNIGGDKLEIHPSDPSYKPGIYSIGILAYKPNMNVFTVKADLSPASPLMLLEHEHFGRVHSWDYYKLELEQPAQSRVEVTVDPGRGVLAMFLSPTLYYPTEREHTWSVVRHSPEHYEDIDPFERVMRKHFARCPNPKEFELLRSKEESGEDERPLCLASGETLVFCNDTDEWKYSNPICFIAVKNLTGLPVEYTIRSREVMEMSLLDQTYGEKFREFSAVFEGVEGSSVSQSERKRLQVSGKSEFTYGEIDFVHMIPVFELCEIQPGQVFWDLGCGAGKCLAAIALLYPQLSAVKGVEFLDKLFELCQVTAERVNAIDTAAKVEVAHGDMLRTDWSDADLIFTSSICFPQALIDGIYEKARQLKRGAKIVTLKNFPPNEEFEVRYNLRVKMTWGRTGVYILEKVK